MTHMLPLLSVIGCAAMMFGAGAIGKLLLRVPLARKMLNKAESWSTDRASRGATRRVGS
jgi:hypothetical protein